MQPLQKHAPIQHNPFAWFNMGTNLVYFERYREAIDAYDTARQLGLPQRMLRYQFGPFLAYFHGSRNDELLALTEYALGVTPNSEEALLWRGWALYRAGKSQEAMDHFNQALEADRVTRCIVCYPLPTGKLSLIRTIQAGEYS
jgi:tetratricopeptide (TPR) repeat protein